MPKELRDRREGSGTMLLHDPPSEVPELVWGHIDTDPVCQHLPDLLRQRVWGFWSRADRE